MTRDGSAARKPTGKTRAERDRHLAEEVARVALADDALDPVDELDRLDPALEHREERPLVALVGRVLARRRGVMSAAARESALAIGRRRGTAKTPICPISSGVTISVSSSPRSKRYCNGGKPPFVRRYRRRRR